ncbi:rubredoxin [Psychromonas sp.]|uniref:rubredoxin n=1 Tax=Psychromonas sp. TaxID=1884585 RepID=UPI00356604C6
MKSATLINSPGGFYTPKDLLHCAGAAKNHGLYLGQRQNIIIPDVSFKHSELQKLSGSIVSEDYYNHTNNIVCSHAAGGLGENNDWAYCNDTYLEILTQIHSSGKLKVNLCSREQSLFPIFSGQLNFITAEEEGYWHLVVNVSNQRQLLPFLFRSNQVHQVIKLIDDQYLPDALLDAEKIMALLSKQLIIEKQLPELELHARHPSDYEGFQQMKNGKFSLNIFSNHKIWDPIFISELCELSSKQGLERIYLTAGRSLLLKHIEENLCFEWQNLIGRHNITLRHSEQDLSWMVPAEKRELVHIKEKIIQRLHAGGLSFLGLYIALDPAEFECGAQIIINTHKQADKYTYQLFHKEDFDYRRCLFICDGIELSFEQLLDSLYSLRKMFFLHSSREKVVVMQALKASVDTEEEMYIYQCPNCLTQYHEAVGQPHIGIAAGTPFMQLPEAWACELCETNKKAFTRISSL